MLKLDRSRLLINRPVLLDGSIARAGHPLPGDEAQGHARTTWVPLISRHGFLDSAMLLPVTPSDTLSA
jgi:hypothetical protein